MNLARDIKATDNGDIEIVDGKFVLADEERTLKQNIEKRLRTDNPDWFRHYLLGADLEDLKGMDNTRETGELGVERIVRALTYDGLIDLDKLYVRAVPTGGHEITFYIVVQLGYNKTISLEFPVDIA